MTKPSSGEQGRREFVAFMAFLSANTALAIAMPVCGPVADALGRKRVLASGLIIIITGAGISTFANSLPMMLVAGSSGRYACQRRSK